jgi:hypothetical protein
VSQPTEGPLLLTPLELIILKLRPLIAIRISVLQYASREFLLERYSAHAVPAEYLRAGPLLNLVSTSSGRLPEATKYQYSSTVLTDTYLHRNCVLLAVNLWANVLLNFVRNHRSKAASKVCPVERPQAESPMEFLYSTCIPKPNEVVLCAPAVLCPMCLSMGTSATLQAPLARHVLQDSTE